MKKQLILLCAFVMISFIALSQGNSTIKGTVMELETQSTIPGALVMIIGDSSKESRATTNDDGFFKITPSTKSIKNYTLKTVFNYQF